MSKIKMDIEAIKEIIARWADSETLIKKAYVFGSRARGDYREDSDLDVAVEIEEEPGDESKLATWIFEKKGLTERLSGLVPYNIQLEHFNGEKTPTVLQGIEQSSILVYEEKSL